MKRLASAVAVIALIGTSAFAADMPLKAPPPAPAPVYSWTGWYVGANFGAGWGTANNNISFTQTDPGGVNPPVFFNAQDSVKFNGPIGGAQVGYDWQVNSFLLGFETDIQASGQSGTNVFNGVIPSFAPNPATVTDTAKLDWFGTVRGRLGLTFDRWLVYGTGGLAYGEVQLKGNVQPANPLAAILNAPIVWDHSSTKAGWVAGGGIENQIDPHWSWKVEYLYMDFGTASAALSGGVGTTGGVAANCYGSNVGCSLYRNPASGTITSRFTDNIVRVGLNYQFH